ncbi:ABC transporter permease [Streptomyces sp. MUM 178J]|uniref:ABC transporter permease n=1 Tax=Streptomyces sp. MUM 178J TaxID=2791991 RepID=UPI001F038FF9|nr:ABC transporter permease [Streptomyces sp. MUM 178J]WRQ79764.1 FtsX-like permease family protein [Streptomyces sp. MUM 178J]
MLRTALRNVLAHKARLLMTVLAVMLGVAFVSGTFVFTDTLGQAFRKQSAKNYDDVAVAITTYAVQSDDGGDDTGVDRPTLDKIRAVDGVASAVGRVSGFAGVADQDGKLIGNGWTNTGANFAPGKDGKDSQYRFTDGSGPVEDGQIALDKDSADTGKYKVGDRVRVATNGPVKEYTLSGVFTTDDGAVSAGGSLVLFNTPVAQKLYLSPGHFKDVNVVAEDGASDEKLLAAIKPLLPEGADARTGQAVADEQAREIEQGMSNFNSMLLAFAAIALFVGVFLIANTFTMLVAQRTKEVALMRAVGASRRQITRSVLAEAALVGLVAATVGFALGVGLAVALRSGMSAFGLKVPGGPLVITATPVVSSLAVGVLITMLAAWLPGRRAAKIPPVAAMGSMHAVPTVKSLVVRNSVGAAVTALGAVLILLGASQGSDGRMVIGGGAFLALIGVIVLIPLLSRPLIAVLRAPMAGLFGVSGKLAGQNAVRNPRRTGATASALAIGLTLVTGLSVLGATVGQAIDKSTTDNLKADYVVMMAAQGMALDESVVPALQKASGVQAVSADQSTNLKAGGDDWQSVAGVTPGDIEQLLNVRAVSGSLGSLADGKLAVEQKTAEQNGWKPGQTIDVQFNDDEKGTLTVGAVYADNDFLPGLMLSTAVVKPHETMSPYIPQVYVKMDGGPTKANERALVDALGDNPAIRVMDQQDVRDEQGGMINMMLNIMYGLLAMALLIAVLGVVNTLAMSVFERQQEIGMLRAIGLDRGRVKRMVRLEAVVISVFGAVIGIGLGAFLGWAIGQTIKDSVPNYALVIPWDRVGLFLVLAALVGMLAAMWPARSAARLNMLSAIKAE